jgi:hypothetical protein
MQDAGMAKRGIAGAILLMAIFCLGCRPATSADGAKDDPTYHSGTGELILGRISFPTSATGKAQAEFITGVLALHSFWYEEARDHFRAAERADPSFGLAYWGEAMSYDNALNTHPEPGSEDRGTEVVEKMDKLAAQGALRWSPREQGFADAVRKRFQRDLSYSQRRQAYVKAMTDLAKQYPNDDEVIAFTAVALLATPGFDVNNPAHVVAVASRLEQVYERNPQHPGALHYLIHVYDTPTFAARGLKAALAYAKIAPASPHALHMPSHIFRHLGMWDEVAASNDAAYKASVAWQKRTGRPVTARDFHALDWLMEADLRLGRVDAAKGVLEELDAVDREIKAKGDDPAEFPQVAAALRKDYAAFAATREAGQ